jgi:hypothetical protein
MHRTDNEPPQPRGGCQIVDRAVSVNPAHFIRSLVVFSAFGFPDPLARVREQVFVIFVIFVIFALFRPPSTPKMTRR